MRAALDTLAEGLVVLDKRDRIVLANRAFADTFDRRAEDLVGQSVSDFPWQAQQSDASLQEYP